MSIRRHRHPRPRGRGNKAKAQEIHARSRAVHRYGIELTPVVLGEWLGQIQSDTPTARFLERQSHRITLWAVRHNGREVPVVYDKTRGTIVSVLPPDVLARFPVRTPETPL